MSISRPLLKFILKLVDLDGSVKDSASPTLKRSREQVRLLETKLHRLMESLISNDMKETSSSVEVSNTDGRWCIKSATDQKRTFDGLLLSRFEPDKLAFSGCYYGGGEKERKELEQQS